MRKSIKKGAAPVVCGLLLFLFLRVILFVGFVPTASMEPTIPADSFVVGGRVYCELSYGDIIIFEHDGMYLVKRIAAMPGDLVYIETETFAVHIGERPGRAAREINVPMECYFLLGDNSADSIDSRFWDDPCIPEYNVVAKLLWPAS